VPLQKAPYAQPAARPPGLRGKSTTCFYTAGSSPSCSFLLPETRAGVPWLCCLRASRAAMRVQLVMWCFGFGGFCCDIAREAPCCVGPSASQGRALALALYSVLVCEPPRSTPNVSARRLQNIFICRMCGCAPCRYIILRFFYFGFHGSR